MQAITLLLAAASAVEAYTTVQVGSFMHKNIDSLVMPGQYKSHLHTFLGSDAVTANTTTSKELQDGGCTTAYNPNDFSIYWVPTLLYVKGTTYTPVPFARFTSYYKGIESAEIPIPQNFKVIAGNSKATQQTNVSSFSGIEWWCDGDDNGVKDLAAFPTKTCSTHLKVLLVFPDCVNPTTLTSAYSGTHNWVGTFKPANRCPEGMKRMPFLRFSITYDLRKLIPGGWSGPPPLILSSGSSYSYHGDFINGWLPEAATDMLRFKTKNTYDGPVVGPKGTDLTTPACKTPKDREPTKGTSDYLTSVKQMTKRSLSRFDRRLV